MKIDPERYVDDYSDDGFWKKLSGFAGKAGRALVEQALVLYFLVQDENVPTKPKAIAIGALGYFILPIDLIPDLIPGVGFTDDLSAIGIAMWQLAGHITDEHRRLAQERITQWFGTGTSGR
ncbi:MAG: YkvA family protein [Planctomycetota bacterium]|jgi:uncharacterized membrane protein YkvA (DUF1232 family)